MTQPFDNRDWDSYQIAEKEALIQGLKSTITSLQRECAMRGQRIADLEKLLIRAADALEEDEELVPSTQLDHWMAAMLPLIDELRERKDQSDDSTL